MTKRPTIATLLPGSGLNLYRKLFSETKFFINFVDRMEEPSKLHEQRVIGSIADLILKRGLKATTMDEVASSLGMSKRTLYEMYSSKKEMIVRVLKYWQGLHDCHMRKLFNNADNMMEAFHAVFNYHHDSLLRLSPTFFEDLDEYFPDARKELEKKKDESRTSLINAIEKGISQHVFRDDVCYEIALRLVEIQMESLKRMEEHFSPEITLSEAFKAITTGFLRSIATPEGMGILDKLYRDNGQ